MIKACFTILMLLHGIFAIAQPPCPMVVAVNGGIPLGNFQFSSGSPSGIGNCMFCGDWNMEASFQILDGIQHVALLSSSTPPCPEMQVRIAHGCDTVVFDSCMSMPLTGLGCLWEFGLETFGNSQIIVYWVDGDIDSLGILVKSMAPTPRRMYSDLYQMDTCGITQVDESRETPKAYMRIGGGKIVHNLPLPSGMYFELDGVTLLPTKRKICVIE